MLRLGLLLDSVTPSRWAAVALERTLATKQASVALVVLNHSGVAPSAEGTRLVRWWRNRAYLPLAAYERFDRWKFGLDRNWFEPTDISALIGGAEIIRVAPRQTTFSDYFEDADTDRILAYELDIAVRFGFRILRGRALSIAKYGVWSYHHGDNRVNRGGPAGLWEVLEAHPTTGSVLQVLSESLDGGRVLSRSWSRTVPYSAGRNREQFYAQSLPMLAAQVSAVALGLDNVEGETPGEVAAYSRPLYTAPRGGQMLRMAMGVAGRYVANQVRGRLTQLQWFLCYRRTPRQGYDSGTPDLAPFRFTRLVPPVDRFWADPFPVRVADADFIVFEEFVTAEGKGHISVAEIDANGIVGSITRVLEQPYHLSYPFMLAAGGEHYMVPETATARRVEMWRATRFPFEWEKCADLLTDRERVDSTIVRHNGLWWLFAASSEGGSESWDELEIYYASSPLGPWTPHPRNPVKSDVRSARPAGQFFTQNGRLYRPSQDGSLSYGGALAIQEVQALTTTEFRERCVTRVDPLWMPNLVGVHTVNAIDGLTVIDARRRIGRWSK